MMRRGKNKEERREHSMTHNIIKTKRFFTIKSLPLQSIFEAIGAITYWRKKKNNKERIGEKEEEKNKNKERIGEKEEKKNKERKKNFRS